ncbi:MAG: peptidyl-prolyl cis-trans isomerase [Candidatus Cloacimonetes bacterium]|nr:peptidyl-prolyl cis-trans isomerase [Candidatus Cloacimonadota bacterium]
MKYFLVVLLLMFSSLSSSRVIAEIGAYNITSEELQDEMEKYEDSYQYSYNTIRQIAFNNLTEKYLIKNYALEKKISVDNTELEAFFIHQLGDHPRFQTNGTFDRTKFIAFKNTNSGQDILRQMREEILISKTKEILEKSFNITEDKLLKQYFVENTKIDLGYAIIDKQDVDSDIEDYQNDFVWYYRHNKHKYTKQIKVKLKLFIVLDDEFNDSVKQIVSRRVTALILADSTLNAENTIKLREEITKEESSKLAKQKILQLKELLEANANVTQKAIETSYLSSNDKLGKLPDIILQSAFKMEEGQYSEPIELESGYLIFSVVDKKKDARENTTEIANEMWKDFLSDQKKSTDGEKLRKYFENNFEDFIVPVAVVSKIEISNPPLFSSISRDEYQQKIKFLLERSAYEERDYSKILRENNLKEKNEYIYLKKFENSDLVNEMIALRLNRDENWGFLYFEDKLIFYKIILYFPEFIPSFDRINHQLPQLVTFTHEDSLELKNYFEAHESDFRTPDSLQIGGAIFFVKRALEELEETISESELRKIYQTRMNEFYRERSVKFDYIFCHDRDQAEEISAQANKGIDVSFLKMIFNFDIPLPGNSIVPYDELPKQITEPLENLQLLTWSRPIKYNDGWIILNKKQNYNAGIIPFSELNKKLRDEVLYSIAETKTYNRTKTVFDSTTYFSHLKKFVDDDNIFVTEFQDANNEFDVLGNISNYRSELLRMWKNEKYSGIINLEDAFAVIFQLNINRSRRLTYEEALPQIREIHNSKLLFEKARSNLLKIKDRIASGEDPESLLFYLGGWKLIQDLSLTSTIPGISFSEAIFDDILKHQESYCSSIIPVNSEKFLFYKLIKLNKPSKNDFYSDIEYYKNQLQKKEFEKWKDKYKVKLGVN